MTDKKEIILNFDFPQGVDSSIKNIMDDFYNETEWKISLNEKINNSSADLLIKKLIDPMSIKKISFYPDKLSVQVFLNGKNTCDSSENEIFEAKTGWKLFVVEEGTSATSNTSFSDKLYFEVDNVIAIEQNAALNLIDKSFEAEEHKPYKKSIKNNDKENILNLYLYHLKSDRNLKKN